MTAPSADPARCPLCGQPNRCAMEAARSTGARQPPCWCSAVQIDPAVLARIPAAARQQRCLCPACATQGAPHEHPHA